MSRAKFWTLNLVGGACGLLLAVNLVFSYFNERSGLALNQTQQQLNRAQQVRTTMQNFAVRLAQLGQTEPALRDLLARHELRVTLDNDNPQKP